jgi:hypothetical protein
LPIIENALSFHKRFSAPDKENRATALFAKYLSVIARAHDTHARVKILCMLFALFRLEEQHRACHLSFVILSVASLLTIARVRKFGLRRESRRRRWPNIVLHPIAKKSFEVIAQCGFL